LVFYLEFDAEGRTDVGALDDGAADPDVSGEHGHFFWIEDRVAAGVANHGVLGGVKAIVAPQLVEIGEVFEVATAVGGAHDEGPVGGGLRSGAGRQAHQQSRKILSGGGIFKEEVFRGPRCAHFRDGGDNRFSFGSVGIRGGWVGSGKRHLELRRRGSWEQFRALGADGEVGGDGDEEQDGE